MAVAEVHRNWEFFGQDVDLRCVRMTSLNLAFRNLYGYVIHGNSLALETRFAYRTGFNGRGVIRSVAIEDCPVPVQRAVAQAAAASQPSSASTEAPPDDAAPRPVQQLHLF